MTFDKFVNDNMKLMIFLSAVTGIYIAYTVWKDRNLKPTGPA